MNIAEFQFEDQIAIFLNDIFYKFADLVKDVFDFTFVLWSVSSVKKKIISKNLNFGKYS